MLLSILFHFMSPLTILCHFNALAVLARIFCLEFSSELADVSWTKFLKMLFIHHKFMLKEKNIIL